MKGCYTCGKPLGKFDSSGECTGCRDAVWRERSAPTRVPASREVVAQEVRDLLERKAAEARVEEVVTDTMTRTAYHEAGHAIVALSLGLPVEEVRLDLDLIGNGECRAVGRESELALVSLGGAVAERRFLGDVGDGCGHDEDYVWAVVEERGGVDATLVESIVRDNAAAVQTVAQALLEYGRLTGGDVEAVLRGAAVATEARSAAVTGQRRVECRDGSVRYVGEEHYRGAVRDFEWVAA